MLNKVLLNLTRCAEFRHGKAGTMRKRMKKALAVIGAMAMALTPVIGIQMQETVYAYDPETDGAPVYEYQEPTGKTYDFAITGTVVMSQVQEFVRLVNEARAAEGLQPVTLDSELQEVAELRAAQCDFNWEHYLPDGRPYWEISDKLNKWEGGEIISSSTNKVENLAKEAFRVWMLSSGHKAVIMNPNQRSIGVGFVVQDFGITRPDFESGSISGSIVATFGTDVGNGEIVDFSDYQKTFQVDNAIDKVKMIVNDSTINPIEVEETLQLYPKYYHKNTRYMDSSCGTWVSLNEEVATVDENGLVTAVAPGKTEVRFLVNGDSDKYYSAPITVNGFGVDEDGDRCYYRDGEKVRSDWASVTEADPYNNNQVGTVWYHFDADGKMQTGWITDETGWKVYNLDSNGRMRYDMWINMADSQDGRPAGLYHLNSDGSVQMNGWAESITQGIWWLCRPGDGWCNSTDPSCWASQKLW